ncbi:MAG: GGDEF domain-containing phosphodiesterase, partial [Clostridia bacterium]|nr:GGDEF domain-containing phosphodiesterase [Clostridia bacterium]
MKRNIIRLRGIVFLFLFCILTFFPASLAGASITEASIYDDALDSVYNIILTIIVVILCFGILIYIYIKNSNKRIKEILGDELYGKLYKFRRIENTFNKAIKQAGKGIVIILKISNIDFLKELYGANSVENYVAKIGEKLKADLPSGFIFGRIAISEFIIYTTDEKDETILRAEVLQIFNSMKEAITLNEMRINSNFNMGVAKMTSGTGISREIIRRATLAMWYSKRQGPNRFRYYSSEIDEKFIKEEEIQKELSRALNQDEFELYYQPIINSDDGSIYGVEALIRWNHPEKGVLKPNYFLQEAEKNEMIVDIGYWVIDRAFKDYNTILNRFDSGKVNNLRLSINISPNQFKDKYLVENLKNYIIKYNMNPENVVLEITEQVYIQETLRVNDLLRSIKKLGCRIAFDDFGIEYSTLSKLQDLNFDVVKIDRQFILGIPEDKVSVEIVKMLSSLTDITEKKLIAEGVDNEEQLRRLREYGCRTIQGYYYSKALSIEKLLSEIYERNINNENFNDGIMSGGIKSTESDQDVLKKRTIELYEQFFLRINAPASINRLIEDSYTGKDDIMLTAVNSRFAERFFVEGESLIGRKSAAVYPSINQIQMSEIAKGVKEGRDVRFPYFYQERTASSFDLSVIYLFEDKFAMIFMDTTENSSTLNKLKITNRNLEEVKYMLDISLTVGNVDVWEYDIENHKIRMIWHDICGDKLSYMEEYNLDEYIDWIHPDEQGRFRREFMNCILRAKSKKYDPDTRFSFDYRLKPPHRQDWVWVSTKMHIIEYSGENPETAAAVNVDITQRKKYEDTIK